MRNLRAPLRGTWGVLVGPEVGNDAPSGALIEFRVPGPPQTQSSQGAGFRVSNLRHFRGSFADHFADFGARASWFGVKRTPELM